MPRHSGILTVHVLRGSCATVVAGPWPLLQCWPFGLMKVKHRPNVYIYIQLELAHFISSPQISSFLSHSYVLNAIFAVCAFTHTKIYSYFKLVSTLSLIIAYFLKKSIFYL